MRTITKLLLVLLVIGAAGSAYEHNKAQAPAVQKSRQYVQREYRPRQLPDPQVYRLHPTPFVAKPTTETETSYHETYTKNGVRFGRLGAMSYMLDKSGKRISGGYHEFKKLPDGHWLALIGSSPHIVSPSGKDVTEQYLRDFEEKRKRIEA